MSAGLQREIIERSLGDLDGFVEHLEEYEIKGKLYAENVMEAGNVAKTALPEKAYAMGQMV